MRLILILVASLAPILVASLAVSTARARDVSDLSQRWSGYWNAKNLDATMTLYAPDAAFLPPVGKAWHGVAEIRRQCAAALAVYEPHIELTSERSERSGTLAFDTGTYDETLNPVKGGKSVHAKGSYLFLFKRGRDGRWRILEQSWSETTPVKL
ncbi:MAG: SgcJ/EcaC family oxidoreductase [Alphaproteobacteria bacterium]|nr:SgcJ/EcaC family oxidoreductase [Alphaproteobacteria bacterium]